MAKLRIAQTVRRCGVGLPAGGGGLPDGFFEMDGDLWKIQLN